MPAAAVIPAPIVYMNVVAVKKLVVGNEFLFFFKFKIFLNFLKKKKKKFKSFYRKIEWF